MSGEMSSSHTNLDSTMDNTSKCLTSNGTSNGYSGGNREKDWSKSLWLFSDQWYKHRQDMKQLTHILHSINTISDASSPMCELCQRSIAKVKKIQTFLDSKCITLSHGGLVFDVLLRSVSLHMYKGLWRGMVKHLMEILEYSSNPGPVQSRGNNKEECHAKPSTPSSKPYYVGLERQFVMLITYKQLIEQHLKDPWGLTELTPMRTVLTFEMIRMDLTTRVETLVWFYQQQQQSSVKVSTPSPLFPLAQAILKHVPALDMFKWVELDYFVAKTELLLSQFALEIKSHQAQELNLSVTSDVLFEWLSYAKSLRYLLEPLCDKELHGNLMVHQSNTQPPQGTKTNSNLRTKPTFSDLIMSSSSGKAS